MRLFLRIAGIRRFGECWIGTETRDANPDPVQGCCLMEAMDCLTGGKCGGGWYDALDCTPEKFVEQARYTILGGARESLVHCYDYLLAKNPGSTPFGEKADRSHACAAAFSREVDGLAKLAEFLRGAERKGWEWWDRECSVSCHEFKKGNRLYVAFQNVSSVKKRIHSCPTQYFRPLLSLPDGSAFKSEMVQSSMSSVAYDIEPHGFLFVESEMGVL